MMDNSGNYSCDEEESDCNIPTAGASSVDYTAWHQTPGIVQRYQTTGIPYGGDVELQSNNTTGWLGECGHEVYAGRGHQEYGGDAESKHGEITEHESCEESNGQEFIEYEEPEDLYEIEGQDEEELNSVPPRSNYSSISKARSNTSNTTSRKSNLRGSQGSRSEMRKSDSGSRMSEISNRTSNTNKEHVDSGNWKQGSRTGRSSSGKRGSEIGRSGSEKQASETRRSGSGRQGSETGSQVARSIISGIMRGIVSSGGPLEDSRKNVALSMQNQGHVPDSRSSVASSLEPPHITPRTSSRITNWINNLAANDVSLDEKEFTFPSSPYQESGNKSRQSNTHRSINSQPKGVKSGGWGGDLSLTEDMFSDDDDQPAGLITTIVAVSPLSKMNVSGELPSDSKAELPDNDGDSIRDDDSVSRVGRDSDRQRRNWNENVSAVSYFGFSKGTSEVFEYNGIRNRHYGDSQMAGITPPEKRSPGEHYFKVVERTSQKMRRGSDGSQTVDTVRTLEREEKYRLISSWGGKTALLWLGLVLAVVVVTTLLLAVSSGFLRWDLCLSGLGSSSANTSSGARMAEEVAGTAGASGQLPGLDS